jgi:hypothetical protein
VSTFIDLDDGRTWRAANWAYDAVVEAIADELNGTDSERELAAWLRSQTCAERGPGLGAVDVRELSPPCRLAFRQAARRAVERAARSGGTGWHDPSFFPGWLDRFRELLRMWEAIDRGEPVRGAAECAPPTGRRVGPGWGPAADPASPDPTGT